MLRVCRSLKCAHFVFHDRIFRDQGDGVEVLDEDTGDWTNLESFSQKREYLCEGDVADSGDSYFYFTEISSTPSTRLFNRAVFDNFGWRATTTAQIPIGCVKRDSRTKYVYVAAEGTVIEYSTRSDGNLMRQQNIDYPPHLLPLSAVYNGSFYSLEWSNVNAEQKMMLYVVQTYVKTRGKTRTATRLESKERCPDEIKNLVWKEFNGMLYTFFKNILIEVYPSSLSNTYKLPSKHVYSVVGVRREGKILITDSNEEGCSLFHVNLQNKSSNSPLSSPTASQFGNDKETTEMAKAMESMRVENNLIKKQKKEVDDQVDVLKKEVEKLRKDKKELIERANETDQELKSLRIENDQLKVNVQAFEEATREVCSMLGLPL